MKTDMLNSGAALIFGSGMVLVSDSKCSESSLHVQGQLSL